MTITLSQQDYWNLVRQAQEDMPSSLPDSNSHGVDVVWQYPKQLGRGFIHEIQLRQGVELAIANYQTHDGIITDSLDCEHPLEYTFNISKGCLSSADTVPYHLYGSGVSPGGRWQQYANQQHQWVSVHIEPDAFQSFVGDASGHVPAVLQHLIGDPNQAYYVRPGRATPAMHVALQQILQCPYHGWMKRLFLDSKVLELMTLLLAHEVEARQGKQPVAHLKLDDVDRLHQAKAILHQNLENPPSMMQLARQVGLNECTLKQGFRQIFNTTVFGYLRQYRMEQARSLLMQGRMNVGEVAKAVGYTSQSRFAAVFRKTFGVNPKAFSIERSR